MTKTTTPPPHRPEAARIRRAIERRAFATLATTSPAGRPHVAGVLFEALEQALYISTLRTSRKARNIAANSHVAVCVPVRRLPVGPPSTIHFQTSARVLDLDDPEILARVEEGALRSITSHGELELADGCFLRVDIPGRLLTYGLGMPLRRLIADPLSAGGSVTL
jgi:hypothetical protein